MSFSRAEQFNDLLEKAERDFVSAPLPSDVEMARIMTSQHQELKKRMLESLMYSLQDGQMLLENLRNLESQGTVDSRPDHIRLNVRFGQFLLTPLNIMGIASLPSLEQEKKEELLSCSLVLEPNPM